MHLTRHINRDTAQRVVHTVNPGWSRRQWLLGAAWFFIAFTVGRLIWAIGVISADPATTISMIGNGEFTAPLLTYAGGIGAVWAWLQAIIIGVAAVFSVTRFARFRRIGHIVLIGWAALWLGGFIMYAAAAGGFGPMVQCGLMAALLGCTVYRVFAARPVAPDAAPVDGGTATDRVVHDDVAVDVESVKPHWATHAPATELRAALEGWSQQATAFCDRALSSARDLGRGAKAKWRAGREGGHQPESAAPGA